MLSCSSIPVVFALGAIFLWPTRRMVTQRAWTRGLERLCGIHFTLKLRQPPGFAIRGRMGDYADFHAVTEVFLERAYAIDRLKTKPALIVDAGAHIGMFSLLAGSVFPQSELWAFEPDLENYRLLQGNLEANSIRARCHNAALGDSERETFLAGTTSMGRHIGAPEGQPIRVKKLSDYDLGRYASLLLKIDVEGSEWEVLGDCGPCLPESTVIYIEVHDGPEGLKRLEAFAEKFGFHHRVTREKGRYYESILTRGSFRDKPAHQT